MTIIKCQYYIAWSWAGSFDGYKMTLLHCWLKLCFPICRSVNEEKMAQFFKNNFSEDRWRKAALKNAFSLLGKQKFERAAAFFLLGGAVKDAIEVL